MATTWVGTVLEPYLNFLRSLPPLAYIGLLIVWFGIGDTSKIWLLFLAAFPPITMATITGVRGVARGHAQRGPRPWAPRAARSSPRSPCPRPCPS